MGNVADGVTVAAAAVLDAFVENQELALAVVGLLAARKPVMVVVAAVAAMSLSVVAAAAAVAATAVLNLFVVVAAAAVAVNSAVGCQTVDLAGQMVLGSEAAGWLAGYGSVMLGSVLSGLTAVQMLVVVVLVFACSCFE